MLRKWLGTSRHAVGRIFNRFRVFWLPLSKKRQLVYGAGMTVGLIAIVLVAVTVFQIVDKRFFGPQTLDTPEQAMADNLKDYLANPPAKNASASDKAVYDRRLSVAQASANNYSAAAAALAQQEKSKPGSLTYDDYKLLAAYYHKAHNDQAALQTIDEAQSVMPKQDDLSQGYSVKLETATLNELRQEYK